MPIEQTTDLLEKLKNVHHDLAQCYEAQESDVKKDKVQLMLNYLKEQEQNLAAAVEKFQKTGESKALSTYYSQSPDQEQWDFLASCRLTKDISYEDLVQEVVKTGEAYIDILEDIHTLSEMDSQKKIFKDLVDGATHTRNQFIYNAMMLGDG
ncbi:MAG: hypothetical protein ABUK01_12915 [Leptospirales bacterium]